MSPPVHGNDAHAATPTTLGATSDNEMKVADMGFLDRLFGRSSDKAAPTQQAGHGQPQAQPTGNADDQAVQRYEYLLRTAPPDQIERAHQEAFGQLTPAQRQQVLNKLAQTDPHEAPKDDSPAALARSATRIEMNKPGSLKQAFGGPGGRLGGAGLSMGGLLLGSVAGAFVGTAIATQMFDEGPQAEGDMAAGEEPGADAGDAGDGDFGGSDYSSGGFEDSGGFGDFGGGGFDGGGGF